MFTSKKTFNFGVGLGILSLALLAFAVFSMMQAKEDLLASVRGLQIDASFLKEVPTSPELSTDEKITEARRAIQSASSRIRSLKITIFNNAERAAAERSLVDARVILLDIANNAQKVADAHEKLEEQFFDLIELYNRKIEEVYKSQTAAKDKASYGLSFWVGVVGVIGGISTMILAWRKDHREVRELELEIQKLKAELEEA